MAAVERFLQKAIARFANNDNGVAAGRILNACLLPPVTDEWLEQLQPLGDTVTKWTTTFGTNDISGWTAIPIGLWKYRQSDYRSALNFCQRGLLPKGKSAYAGALHAIAAMSFKQTPAVQQCAPRTGAGPAGD